MIDTSIEHAIEASIIDFNEWAQDVNHHPKFSNTELKGVFLNKLKKRLDAITYAVPQDFYSVKVIELLDVHKGRIIAIKFQKLGGWYESTIINDFCKKINSILSTINLHTIEFNKLAHFEKECRNIVHEINNYKVL